MIEGSQRQSQASFIRDLKCDEAASTHSAHREEQNDQPFFYENSCLGSFSIDPVDFHDFAKGQLLAMAIFVPAALALFIFCAS